MENMSFNVEVLPYTVNYIVTDGIDGEVLLLGEQYQKKNVFKVAKEGNTVVVTLPSGIKGKAKCSPDDVFDLNKGMDIAHKRACLKETQKELAQLTK